MMNFNEICRKNVPHDNIKCHQKSRLHPLSRKHNFEKTNCGGEVKLTLPAFLGLIKSQGFSLDITGRGIPHRCLP